MNASNIFVWILVAVASSIVSGEPQSCQQATIKCFDYYLNAHINTQISVQHTGHYTFLYLAQLFDRHTSFYPEIAKYFRGIAEEDLKHAHTFTEYQNQRGGTVEMGGQYDVKLYTDGACHNITSAAQAFQCGFQLQAYVTHELTQLRNHALTVTVHDWYHNCSNVFIYPEDHLLLSQSLLVTCKTYHEGTEDIVTADWMHCFCDEFKNVEYTELAEMIAVDQLANKSKYRKEMANYYNMLNKSSACKCEADITEYLLDGRIKPPNAPVEDEE